MRVRDQIIAYTLDCIRSRPHHPVGRLWLFLLVVVSRVYAPLVRARGFLYAAGWIKKRELPVPVISVGNITLGGTGKTPLVERIARAFAEGGKRVAILMRGYRGSFAGETLIVSDGARIRATPRQAGDEAFLLAQELPSARVVIGKDRHRAGGLAVSHLGAQILILDDGFQHLVLKRNLDIVLLDAAEPFGHGHLFPRGLLREPPEALSRADAIIVTDASGRGDLEEVRQSVRRHNVRAPLFTGERRPLYWARMPGRTPEALETLTGKGCIAFCGIANPASFFTLVSSLAVEILRSFPFPDHHPYSLGEVQQMAERSKALGAEALLTTEKDAVRLPPEAFPLPLPLFYLRMELRLFPEEEFFLLLSKGAHPSGEGAALASKVRQGKGLGGGGQGIRTPDDSGPGWKRNLRRNGSRPA